MPVVPMFPLGGVLVPGSVLPLHVFEPRYQQLVRDCVEADSHEFGVVLIDRGHEVGGGDVRRDVGTMARMMQVAELPDGRFAVISVGLRRIRVTEWLPDDPYPRAAVDDWPDVDEWIDPDQLAAVTQRARRAAAMAAELGDQTVEATSPMHEDAALAVHQLAGLAPLGAADVYDLLCQPGPAQRLQLLETMLADVEAAQAFRLRGP